MRPTTPTYNYNYNYSLHPSSTQKQKPRSTNPYTHPPSSLRPAQQPYANNESNARYVLSSQQPIKYYPINQDDVPAFKTTIQSATQSASSFFVNTNKHSRKEFGMGSADFGYEVKSPRTSENGWYNPQKNRNFNGNQQTNNQYAKDHQDSTTKKQQTSQNSPLIQSYIQWLYESFSEFQKAGNIKVLKEINEQVLFRQYTKNSQQVKQIFKELSFQKENIKSSENLPKSLKEVDSQNRLSPSRVSDVPSRSTTRPKTPTPPSLSSSKLSQLKQQLSALQSRSLALSASIAKEHQISRQLQLQLSQELQIKEGKNLDESRVRQENHLKQMQQSIYELEDEIKVLQRKNNELSKTMVNSPFFKEWNMMFQEAKGATKLNIKLKHQIEKKQNLIHQITNEDPSNYSDARSVKRLPSQSGQNPPSFKKQNKIHDQPTPNQSTLKPRSQLPHKFGQRPESSRSNDGVIRHLSHSNRFSQSKKPMVNNSVDKTKERKQSYDQKHNAQTSEWKTMPFPQNLKNFGLNFIGKDVYK